MATLSFQNINKIYPNGVQAVFDFNLEVKDKEFIVFVGPSGCGKSTTLRMIAGLEEISSGLLYIDGMAVNNVQPKDRNIAMVFQSYALYPHMTVFNNMSFSLKLRKVKFPVGEYSNPELSNNLYAENVALFKQIKLINKVIKKQQEPVEALEERAKLLNKIYENEAQRKALFVQSNGINQTEISDCTAAIKTVDKEIKYAEKLIAKASNDIAKLEAKLAALTEEEPKYEEINDALKALVDLKELYEKSLEQKHGQLTKLNEQLEYFQNNETPLTVYRKHTNYEIDIEVYKTAEILDLSRYLFRKPAALSGGQRQRVALGRSIVRNPKVFLMDEPLSNLDAKLRVQMRSEIIKIHETVGATTVYVTHDQTEAMTMASRIVVMKDGYVQQIGTPKEVYSDPNNIFVGGFIGSPAMNFFKGKVEDGKFHFNGSEAYVLLSKKHLETLKDYDGKEVTLGVRPESIYLSNDVNNTNPTNDLALTCDFAELLGYELVIHTFVGEQKLVFKTSIANDIKNRQEIKLSFNSDALYFFDTTTTNRIR